MRRHSSISGLCVLSMAIVACESAVTQPAPAPNAPKAVVAPIASASTAPKATGPSEADRLHELAARVHKECPYQGWGYLGSCPAYKAWRAEDRASDAAQLVLLDLLSSQDREIRTLGASQSNWLGAGLLDGAHRARLMELAASEKEPSIESAWADAVGKLDAENPEQRHVIEAMMAPTIPVQMRAELLSKLYFGHECPSDFLLSLTDGLASSESAMPTFDLAFATVSCDKDRDKLCAKLEQLLASKDSETGFTSAASSQCPRLIAGATNAVVVWAKNDLKQALPSNLAMVLPGLCGSPVANKDTKKNGLEAALILMKVKDPSFRAMVFPSVEACDEHGTALKRLTHDPDGDIAKQATEALKARTKAP